MDQQNDLCDWPHGSITDLPHPREGARGGLSSVEGAKITGAYPMIKSHLTDGAMQMKEQFQM